ncbi:copper homeostasis membrane protein CopD [Providencia burhodogranariea]|uniref:Copper resistance protein D n=1 Tax=Providencia burhodogranariea DSM 19968 TaxID=1141662 RepID=K8X1U9_9GAMM|nr:copper homeostasis membrane protein CopD [Providencia burhodogranariea]EKT63647.1 resistance protein [Providencia burhodogranariea DSM 19968]
MSLETFYTVTRFSHFVAVMLMCGMSIFAVILSVGTFNQILRCFLTKGIVFSAVITAITTFGWTVAQAGLMGDGWEDAFDFEIWLGVINTTFGQVWRWELLCALLTLGVVFIRSQNVKLYLLLVLSVVMLGLHALIGHAAMNDGVAGSLHRLNQFIHLISAAYWFGGLWPFLICIQFLRDKRELAAGLDKQISLSMIRFSRYGHIAVAAVLITGIISSVTLLPNWPFAYSASEYQSLLWLKISLVGLMVLLALVNRYILVPNIKRKGRLQYLIINSWIELLLGTMAILAVAIFATYQPV